MKQSARLIGATTVAGVMTMAWFASLGVKREQKPVCGHSDRATG